MPINEAKLCAMMRAAPIIPVQDAEEDEVVRVEGSEPVSGVAKEMTAYTGVAAKPSKRKREGSDKMSKMKGEVVSKLECPICYNIMLPPIRQCSEGHTLCDTCCQKIMNQNANRKVCPTCRATMANPVARARALEDWAAGANVKVKCDMASCALTFPYAKFDEHKQCCAGRTVVCPLKRCSWRGEPGKLVDHLSSERHG